jgi:nitroimidazol reductase NimA-like FMN-containing flavoprotein (pyridoxamine 5'-phosphate oxidase superfamily)
MYDHAGLEVLERAECLSLLATQPVGRIVFTHRALPAVEPVNYLLDGEQIVVRTRPGSKLAAATRNSVVAFQVDDIDPDRHNGWSVTVVGRASRVEDPAELHRLAALPLRPWAPAPHDNFIRIAIELVNGRRIVAGPDIPVSHLPR